MQLCVKQCRRRVTAVCVRKNNPWIVAKISLVSTIVACFLSVVIQVLSTECRQWPRNGERAETCSLSNNYYTTLHWSKKFNFFFLAHEEKYVILIELLSPNSNV